MSSVRFRAAQSRADPPRGLGRPWRRNAALTYSFRMEDGAGWTRRRDRHARPDAEGERARPEPVGTPPPHAGGFPLLCAPAAGRPTRLRIRHLSGGRLGRRRALPPGARPASAAQRSPGRGMRVADAAPVEDPGRILGVVAELGAQGPHEVPDQVRIGAVAPVPDPAKQRVEVHHPSGVDREQAQQRVLRRGELHLRAADGDPARFVLDLASSVGEKGLTM